MVGAKPDGKRDIRRGTTTATGRLGTLEAQAAIQAAKEGRLQQQAPVRAKRMTMPELADRWYASLPQKVEKRKLERSTKSWYQYPVRHIKYWFRDIAVVDVTARMIEERIDGMRMFAVKKAKTGAETVTETDKPISVRYKRQVRTALGLMFRHAIKVEGLMAQSDNPMPLVDDIRDIAERKMEKRACTIDEVVAILLAEPQFAGNKDKYRYYCGLVVAQAGCYRSEEVTPLLVTDIEPDGSAIDINKAWKLENGRPYIGPTKNVESEAISYLPEYAWRFARWLRDNAEGDYVFQSPRADAPIHPSTYYHNVKRIVAAIEGVRDLNPHELQRHTGVSLGVFEAGIDRRDMMDISRHGSEEAFKGYTHMYDDNKRAAAEKFNLLITEAINAPKK
jgi:integrase